MDSEHEVFIQGIEEERRLEVTFFCRKRRQEVVSICAPLHHGKGRSISDKNAENELECYYLWDFGAKNDRNFIALSPSEIISMKLTDEVFHVHEFYRPSKQA